VVAYITHNLDALQRLVQVVQPCGSYDIPWLELAARCNMPGLVGLLLRYRSFPGLSAHRALQAAIDRGYTKIASMLLEHGVEVTPDHKQGAWSACSIYSQGGATD
jgi:hypothetical protein